MRMQPSIFTPSLIGTLQYLELNCEWPHTIGLISGAQYEETTLVATFPNLTGTKCFNDIKLNCFFSFTVVNGNWGAWGGWTTCSKTCGAGIKSRSRTCSNPAPQNGGLPCAGLSAESTSCNPSPCKGNAIMSFWFPLLVDDSYAPHVSKTSSSIYLPFFPFLCITKIKKEIVSVFYEPWLQTIKRESLEQFQKNLIIDPSQ